MKNIKTVSYTHLDVYKRQQSDQQKYDAALASAENFFKSNDMDAALSGFRSASELKPAESYPKTRIAEIEALQNKKVQGKQAYETAIKNGDQALACLLYTSRCV